MKKNFQYLVLLLWVRDVTARLVVGTDPDTKCSDTYKKNPTKEACLEQTDHFLRPCEYCTPKNGRQGGEPSCYNADEAKWARWFGGEKCETATTISY